MLVNSACKTQGLGGSAGLKGPAPVSGGEDASGVLGILCRGGIMALWSQLRRGDAAGGIQAGIALPSFFLLSSP